LPSLPIATSFSFDLKVWSNLQLELSLLAPTVMRCQS
jgi:hypothetical protein